MNVIRMASEGALEQRLRRIALVYTTLVSHGPCPHADLAHTCERALKQALPECPPVDMQAVVAEASEDLVRMGLMAETGGAVSAVSPEYARQRVRTLLNLRLSSHSTPPTLDTITSPNHKA
jgi:hypothetical protein